MDALPGQGTRLCRQLLPKTGSCRKGGAGKWKLCLQTKLGFAYLWVANSPFGTFFSCSLLTCWEANLLPTGYSKFLHTNLIKLNGYFILLLLMENAFVSSFSCSSFSIIHITSTIIYKILSAYTKTHHDWRKRTVTTTSTETTPTPLLVMIFSLSSIYSFLKVILNFKIIACLQNALRV